MSLFSCRGTFATIKSTSGSLTALVLRALVLAAQVAVMVLPSSKRRLVGRWGSGRVRLPLAGSGGTVCGSEEQPCTDAPLSPYPGLGRKAAAGGSGFTLCFLPKQPPDRRAGRAQRTPGHAGWGKLLAQTPRSSRGAAETAARGAAAEPPASPLGSGAAPLRTPGGFFLFVPRTLGTSRPQCSV